MSGASEFPYPGDDPTELISVSSAFYNAQAHVDSVAKSLGEATTSMKANWQSDAATSAAADLGKFRTTLSEASSHLKSATTAIDTYQGALTRIRSDVDDLRRQLNTAQTVLTGEQTQYARAGRFGEVNQMTPAEVTSYRKGIAGDEADTQRQIRHLDDEYDAIVRRANAATRTCREALSTSIRGRQYSGASVVNVTLGTALGLNNLTLLAAWEAQIEKNPPAFPKGRNPTDTARLVAAYWASLPPEVRQSFINSYAPQVGNTNGVPVVDRSSANVITATGDRGRGEAALRTACVSPTEILYLRTHPSDIAKFKSELESAGMSSSDIAKYINANACLSGMSTAHLRTKATAYLLEYHPTAYNGKGTAALCIGNPDTAANTAFCVPGFSSKVNGFIGNPDQINLYNQMHKSDPGQAQAVVQWLGYDAPGGINVVLDHAAKSGAVFLAGAVAGLQATHDASPTNFTVIGHSYGSVVTADALAMNHMHADNVVLIGSPGAGNAHTAADLGVPAGHVYVGSASRDPVSKVGNVAGALGTDPADVGFGATRFHAEAVGRGGDLKYSFPAHVSTAVPDHTAYYATGQVNNKTVPSVSLQNLSDVATGHGNKILHDGQLAPGRYEVTVQTGFGKSAHTSHHWVDPDQNYNPRWGSPTQ